MEPIETLETPIKSKGDMKDYRLVKLPNGVKALLIRKNNDLSEVDNEALAAANVTISIGSFDDPPNAMGLAHYLEHMVHMGSEKYPDESGYNDFLTANGGKRNAVTGSNYTTYFFCVSEKALPEAFDRLGQMMEAPLLLKNSMQREREAVDSEFQMNKAVDAVRCQSILKFLINDKHPASFFDFGNLKTLKDDISDDDLHSELLKLHSKYVGWKMFVAIQSKKTLDEMQELLIKSFSSIKNGDDETQKPELKFEEIFKPEFSSKIYFIRPKSAKKAFMMTWAIPSVQKHYKCAPLDYITNVFGNDGEGGILNFLREQHLITIMAIYMEENSFSSNADFALVRLACDMTAEGSENVDKIFEAIFAYLLMIKDTSIDEHRRLYEQMKQKTQIEFDFHKESSAMENVMDYSTNMTVYEDVDSMRGTKIFQEFDEKVMVETIKALNERKFNLIFLTDKHDKFEMKEKYFGTEYDEKDFPEEYQKLWDERKENPEFFLEKPNPFKTSNFEIFVDDEESPKYPVKIYDNELIKVWHKLDQKFNMPHVFLKFALRSPIVSRCSENFAMINVFDKLLEFSLMKKLSQASNAGYEVKTEPHRNGLNLIFKGYSDKISLLVDMVTGYLPNCIAESSEFTFNTLLRSMKETCSENLLVCHKLNKQFVEKLLIKPSFDLYQYYHVFDSISFEGLKEFAAKFFSQLKIEALMQGNITKDQAKEVIKIVQRNLSCNGSSEQQELKRRGYQLPVGSSVLRMHSLMPNDDNSFIRNIYQIGPGTLRSRSLAKLLEAILNPKAYEYLRSKEQLGYGVGLQVEEFAEVTFVNLFVMSQEGKNSYSKVAGKMDIFMNEIAKKAIEGLSDEDFETFKEARIKMLLTEQMTLVTEANKNFNEIAEQDYVFDRYELSAKITRALTKFDLQEIFKTFASPENMRKLSVQVIGNKKTEENSLENIKDREFKVKFLEQKLTDDENVITDIDEFHATLLLHPVVKFEIQ